MTNLQDEVAFRIRAELVCCDIYAVVQMAARLDLDGVGESEAVETAIRNATTAGRWHDLCYWGEASARIAEGRCPGYETEPNVCRCGCYGCQHGCGAHDESFPFGS